MKQYPVVAMAAVVALLSLPTTPAAADVAPAPVITTIAGGLGHGPALGIRQSPSAIAGGGQHLYVSDSGSNVVRVVDTVTGDEEVIAGTGDEGNTGDGGPALAASLGFPSGLAVSPAGELYLADSNNQRVRKIDADGKITTVVGTGATEAPLGDGGPATAAHVSVPEAIAFDASGQLYVAESGGHRIRKVDTAGVISTIAGNGVQEYSGDGGPATAAGLDGPGPLAVDAQGRVYVGDGTARVRRIETDGTIDTVVGTGTSGVSGDGGPATAATIGGATALTFDPAGALYLGDSQGRVRKVTPSGTISLVAGGGKPWDDGSDGVAAVTAARMDGMTDLVVATDGSLLIAQSDGRVRRVGLTGLLTTVAGYLLNAPPPEVPRPALDTQLAGRADAMVTDADGSLYLGQGNVIRKIDPSGTLSLVAGKPVATGEAATDPPTQIMGVHGLALDVDGTMYVTDAWRVLRVDPSGALVRLAGKVGVDGDGGDGGPATGASLNHPGGIALDKMGGVFVADTENRRVRRIDPSGRITTVAGTGTAGAGGDGGPATAAQLTSPISVAVGRSGDLYISDRGTRSVRRVSPSGSITTVARFPAYVPTAIFDPYNPGIGVGPLALDGADTVYTTIGSAFAPQVVRLDPAGPVVVAGNGNRGSGGDGGPATAAPLDSDSITFDPAGDLYVSDLMTSRIRKVGGAGAPAPEMHSAGYNGMGQLGTGVAGDRHAPAGVEHLAGVGALSAGAYHALAARDDGTVWAWGWNVYGQLGTGNTTTSNLARQVNNLTDVKAVAGGAFHSLALRNDGTVWAWGWNGFGGLGDGSTTERDSPVRVTGLDHVTAIAAGAYHSLALRDDGSVVAWGFNAYGQLGDGSTTDRHAPVAVTGLTGVASVVGGAFHSSSAQADGTVQSWGWNGAAQLGRGTGPDSHVPVRVEGITGVHKLAAGAYFHTVALRDDGTVWTWGWNSFGQLGTPGPAPLGLVPTQVPGLSGVTSVAGGAWDTLATMADGTVRAWGWNGFGQLGDGTTIDHHAPIRSGLSSAKVTAAGATHTLGDAG